MIEKLRKQFELGFFCVLFSVFLIVWLTSFQMNLSQLNHSLDVGTEMLSRNDQTMPDAAYAPEIPESAGRPSGAGFDFFTVWLDQEHNILQINDDLISESDQKRMPEFTEALRRSCKDRGWILGYRYFMYPTDFGSSIVLINGRNELQAIFDMFWQTGCLFLVCLIICCLILHFVVKRFAEPAAAAEKKQKRFITDAGHELKTPLSVIISLLDLLEQSHQELLLSLRNDESDPLSPVQTGQASSGSCDSALSIIDDIREESMRMNDLVLSLIELARLDEHAEKHTSEIIDLSALVNSAAADYQDLMESIGLQVFLSVEPGLKISAGKEQIRRMTAVFLENAMKYTDPGGTVTIWLAQKRKQIILRIENTYAKVAQTDLDKLFDRFYRADPSICPETSSGVGLSIARQIAALYSISVRAYQKDDRIIGFETIFTPFQVGKTERSGC